MTLDQLRALLAAAQTERAAIYTAAETRFADSEDATEVRGAFIVDSEGNPTDVADRHAGLTETEVSRLAELETEEVTLGARIERGVALETAQAAGQQTRSLNDINFAAVTTTDNPFDSERARTMPAAELRGMATTALEQSRASDEAATAIMGKVTAKSSDEAVIARYVIATSSDDYRSAFAKVIGNKEYMLTESERRSLGYANETRAAITINTGLSFPVDIDPTFIQTGTMAMHPFRNVATVKSGTENSHKVNVFGSATFAMAADGAEVAADGTPADSSVTMLAQTMQGLLQYTIASAEDLDSLVSEFGPAAANGIGVVESDQFTNGTGTAPEVEGLLDGTTITRVTTAAIDTLTEADLIAAYDALLTRYRPNATWQTSVPAMNDLRVLENTAGNRIGTAPTIADGNRSTLMGRPWYENSELPGPSASTVWTTGDVPVIVGDIAQAYRIYDVLGMTVELIPHMFGTTGNLPNGTRGLYIRKRMAAGITDAAAAKCIVIG